MFIWVQSAQGQSRGWENFLLYPQASPESYSVTHHFGPWELQDVSPRKSNRKKQGRRKVRTGFPTTAKVSRSKSEEKHSHVGYGVCGGKQHKRQTKVGNHNQPISGFHLLMPSTTSSFLFFSRAFGVADSGRKWVLMREPKLEAIERFLAAAALWCLANLSLEGDSRKSKHNKSLPIAL